MLKRKKLRKKPLYKKFITLRANVQYRSRLIRLKFKKKKWQRLISYIKRLQNRRKKKFKIFDLNKYPLPKFYNPFKRRYQMVLHNKQKMSLFYGFLSKKFIKKNLSLIINQKKTIKKNAKSLNSFFFRSMENRLDVILYRSHFAPSVSAARQLMLHHHIKVNGNVITNHSYTLMYGDTVTVKSCIQPVIYDTVIKSHMWPLPPKYLKVNYKTFEILINGKVELQNLSTLFPFLPNVYYLLSYAKR